MNIDKYSVQGFVKRASQLGIKEEVAIVILKHAAGHKEDDHTLRNMLLGGAGVAGAGLGGYELYKHLHGEGGPSTNDINKTYANEVMHRMSGDRQNEASGLSMAHIMQLLGKSHEQGSGDMFQNSIGNSLNDFGSLESGRQTPGLHFNLGKQ